MSSWGTVGGARPLKNVESDSAAPGAEYYTLVVHYPGLHPLHFIPMITMYGADGEPLTSVYNKGTRTIEAAPHSDDLLNEPVQNWKTQGEALNEMDQGTRAACNAVKNLLNKGKVAVFFHNACIDRCSLFRGEHLHIVLHSEATASGRFRKVWDGNPWKNTVKAVKAVQGYCKSQEVRHLTGLMAYLKQEPRVFMGANDYPLMCAFEEAARTRDLPGPDECITEVESEPMATSSGVKRGWGQYTEQVQKKAKSGWGTVSGSSTASAPSAQVAAVADTPQIDMCQPQPKVVGYSAVDDFARVLKVLMCYFMAYDPDDMFKRIAERAGDESPTFKHYAEVWKRLSLRSTVGRTMQAVKREIAAEWIKKPFAECVEWYCKHVPDSDKYETAERSFHIFISWCEDQKIELFSFIETVVKVLDRVEPKLNCLLFHGPTNGGKTVIISNPLTELCQFVGLVGRRNTQSAFSWQELPNKRLIALNECVINPGEEEDMKLLYGGEPVKTDVKYGGQVTIDRTPIILTCNKPPWCLLSFEHEAPLRSRLHYYATVAVPELESVKKQLNPRMWWYLLQLPQLSSNVFAELSPEPEYVEEEPEDLN